MQIAPSFDPSTMTWFTEDGLEAVTLRELKKQLPPRTGIVNYYPKGYTVVYRPLVPEAKIGRSFLRTNYSPPSRKIRAYEIDNRLVEKAPTQKIVSGKELPPAKLKPSKERVRAQAPLLRQSVSRGEVDYTKSRRWSLDDDAELERLVNRGWSAGQIALKFGVTRNSAIGRVHRIGLRLGQLRGER